MNMETEVILGQVIAKANSYLIGGRGEAQHLIKNDRIRAYERSFVEQCKIYKDRHIKGSFKLFIAVYHSSIKYDLDNSLKTILDCLQYVGAIENDNKCFGIVAEKRIDKKNPRVVFAIEPINEQVELFKG